MKGTITSKQEIERLFQQGRRSSSSVAAVIVLPSQAEDGTGRCMYVAGKKLGTAPMRNRCKRVLRHVARELGAPWQGYDVVFMARRGVARAPHRRVVGQVQNSLRKLGVL